MTKMAGLGKSHQDRSKSLSSSVKKLYTPIRIISHAPLTEVLDLKYIHNLILNQSIGFEIHTLIQPATIVTIPPVVEKTTKTTIPGATYPIICIEAIVRKRRILFAGFVARMGEERLPQRVMFGELVGGKGYSGGQEKDWMAHVKEDMSVFGMKLEG